MVPAADTLSAPRKDISRSAKRKRSKSVSVPRPVATTVAAASDVTPPPHTDVFDINTVDYEAIMNTLTDDALLEAPAMRPAPAAPTTVNYYTANYDVEPYIPQMPHQQPQQQHQQQQHQKQASDHLPPRLLLRQSYKLANHAHAVVGVETSTGFEPAIYLVGNHTSVKLTIEDILMLRSLSVSSAVDKYFTDCTLSTTYLDTVLLEAVRGGGGGDNSVVGGSAGVAFCNYELRPKFTWRSIAGPSRFVGRSQGVDVHRQTPTAVVLYSNGWTCLKRLFDCLCSYYNICVECSPIVSDLITRYTKFLRHHYRARSQMANNTNGKLDPELVHYVNTDLPLYMQGELNESHLPPSSDDVNLDAAGQHFWYRSHKPTSPLHTALTPWIDAEVRRYCVSNVMDRVLDELLDLTKW